MTMGALHNIRYNQYAGKVRFAKDSVYKQTPSNRMASGVRSSATNGPVMPASHRLSVMLESMHRVAMAPRITVQMSSSRAPGVRKKRHNC